MRPNAAQAAAVSEARRPRILAAETNEILEDLAEDIKEAAFDGERRIWFRPGGRSAESIAAAIKNLKDSGYTVALVKRHFLSFESDYYEVSW